MNWVHIQVLKPWARAVTFHAEWFYNNIRHCKACIFMKLLHMSSHVFIHCTVSSSCVNDLLTALISMETGRGSHLNSSCKFLLSLVYILQNTKLPNVLKCHLRTLEFVFFAQNLTFKIFVSYNTLHSPKSDGDFDFTCAVFVSLFLFSQSSVLNRRWLL